MTDYDLKLKCFALATQATHPDSFEEVLDNAKDLYAWAKTPIGASPQATHSVWHEDPHE